MTWGADTGSVPQRVRTFSPLSSKIVTIWPQEELPVGVAEAVGVGVAVAVDVFVAVDVAEEVAEAVGVNVGV